MTQKRTKQPYEHNAEITTWLFENASDIGRRSNGDLAEWAARVLKFPITSANIKLILLGLKIRIDRDMTYWEVQMLVKRSINKFRAVIPPNQPIG
jgi:hypothetical protein